MPLVPLYGHERLRRRLADALVSGRLPQSILLSGPPGVGKQRLALWLGQALLCDRPDHGTPCGECPACRRATRLEHPDLHWFVPLPRVQAASPDKAVEKTAEALAEVMATRRGGGTYRPADGMSAHHVASVRLLVRRVGVRPALASRQVFIVGDAERLVSQEASPEAANALLKVLEEPPPYATLILTSARAQSLLPTIRSRVIQVRVPQLADSVVIQFLTSQAGMAQAEAVRLAGLARGSIGDAIVAADGPGNRLSAERVLAAAAGDAGQRAALCLSQPPWSARGDFAALLDDLGVALRERAREVSSNEDGDPRYLVDAISAVEDARELAAGNVNPQLLLADIVERLAETRCR